MPLIRPLLRLLIVSPTRLILEPLFEPIMRLRSGSLVRLLFDKPFESLMVFLSESRSGFLARSVSGLLLRCSTESFLFPLIPTPFLTTPI